jgi:protein TonB
MKRSPLRFVIVTVVAGGVTLGLFWIMQALVGVAYELRDAKASPVVDFVRLKRDATPEPKKREMPKLTPPEQPPPPPQIAPSNQLDPSEGVQQILAVVDAVAEIEAAASLAGGGSDRDVVPLVRVDPQYPLQAARRGIEGWVVVRFTISAAGTVKDAVVTASDPRSIFDKAVLQAVSKWKYNPKIENGAPVERTGVTVRLDFDLRA